MAVEKQEENKKKKFWEAIKERFWSKNNPDAKPTDPKNEEESPKETENEENPKLGEKEDKNLTPETRTLLDEDFWRNATPQKVQELISKGADVNAENKKGMTAAHYAALHGDVAIIKVLGENGADMNHGDIKAETPAHKVAKNEQSNDVLKEMAKYNADFNATNIYGESAREMIQKNQQDAEPLLKEIDEIQQKKEKDPQEHRPNELLRKGAEAGKNDPRNELNNPPKKDNKVINPALLNSQKDY